MHAQQELEFDVRTDEELQDDLNTVITIPLIPFRNGRVDFEAHQKNIRYLMDNNTLSDDRPRVICIAGTSLIHHVDYDIQNQLIDVTGQIIGDDGVLISAIAPNPISCAGKLIEEQSNMKRVPDAYLIMPLGGTYSRQGLYDTLMEFGEQYGRTCAARFLYYYRQPRDRDVIVSLIRDSAYFVGVKVGTVEEDIPVMKEAIGDQGIVIWGVGDRSTKAARMGAKGHTSGISVLCAKAGDAINNAQREGNYEESQRIEDLVSPLEQIRFENGREFNYSAVVEAMNASGFADIDGGEGGPFNPPLPDETRVRVEKAIKSVLDLH